MSVHIIYLREIKTEFFAASQYTVAFQAKKKRNMNNI